MQSKRNQHRHVWLLLPFAVLMFACGGDKSEDSKEATGCAAQTTATAATYDQLWTNVFSTQCLNCHGVDSNTDTQGGPDLTTKDLFHSELFGKKGSDYPNWRTFQINRASCADFEFIKASAANQSMVVAVLDSSVTLSGCTLKSHREDPQNICITDANLAKLKEWINAGASK